VITALERVFSADGFMPHGMCYLWQPGILVLHVASDSLITLAYFSIPFTLIYFVRKRADLHFAWVFVCFAVFIVACGASHFMEIWTIWRPTYWLAGGIKAVTALASVPTAILLVRLVPAALRVPSPSALQAANAALAREVLERKRAEENILQINALLEARVAERTAELGAANHTLTRINARFAIAAEAAGLGFWDFDLATNTFEWDSPMFQLYGRPPVDGAQPYALWADSLHCDDREMSEQTMTKARNVAGAFESEFRVVHPSGDIRHLRSAFGVARDGEGLPVQMFGVTFDITERKRATEQFRLALEAAPTGMLLMDEAGTIVLVNAQIETLFGYRRDELLGQRIEMLVPERFRAYHPGVRSVFFGDPKTRVMGAGRELYGLRKDDTEVPIEIGLNPLRTSEGNFVLSSIADITDRKRADEDLRALNVELEQRVSERTSELKERESLLQEVHHRVKNNLQVITSLINIQIRGFEEGSSRAALRQCQSRLETMAEIHEMLYQSDDYAQVPFAKYAKDLTTRVLSASGTSTSAVALKFELEELSLPVEQAIPCGLILNELVANSLQHAFPNATNGTIFVELRRAPDHSVFLAVSDNGIGISATLDLETLSSLGVQLVITLVEQLEGRLEIDRQPGSAFRITFPLESRT
jgi:PAS domain S-box-containing protein